VGRFYWLLLRQAITSLIGITGRIRTAVALVVFFLTAFNREWVSYVVSTWSGFSPWYALGLLIVFLLYEMARVNYQQVVDLESASRVLKTGELVPLGPPVVMRDSTFDREVAVGFSAAYDVIKPGPQDVFKYERRGFERIFIESQGLSCQVVIGGSADRPGNVPMRRKKIGEGAKKLLRTAYNRSARPDIGYCFVYDALSDNPTIRLDDGTELVGYYAIEAVKDLNTNRLAVVHPTEPNLHWLTELGKGWALDIIERGLGDGAGGRRIT